MSCRSPTHPIAIPEVLRLGVLRAAGMNSLMWALHAVRLTYHTLSCPGPSAGVLAEASVNCTCHQVPSTQLVSCLLLCEASGHETSAPSLPVSSRPLNWPVPCFLSTHINMYILRPQPAEGYLTSIFHAMTCITIFSKVLG